MTLTVTHAYDSTVAPGPTDGLPGGKVGPNEWNANHTVAGFPGGATEFLRADGTFAVPSGGSSGLSPKNFGAFGDGNSHQITSTDITNNPQWIGPFNQSPLTTYPVGTEWDVVGLQEWIYASVAPASTPGNVVWNASSNASPNLKMTVPAGGHYLLNRQIFLAAEGFDFEFEDRLNTLWQWDGYATFTCNSHSSTTLDGISSTDIAPLFVGMYLFDATEQLGVGSIPNNTYITAIDVVAGSITISNATTSTVSSLSVQPQSSMLLCDAVSYGKFTNVTLFSSALITNAKGSNGGVSSNNALWVVNFDDTIEMLRPQQLTFEGLVINGSGLVDTGVAFCPSGSGAQGDTVVWLNCFFGSCNFAAVSITGDNALSHQFINGDIQHCYQYGIYCSSGSFYLDGTSFQNELNDLDVSPQLGQIPWATFDCYQGPSSGPSSAGDIRNVRSEASCGVYTQNGETNVSNYRMSGADCFDWFTVYPYQLLTCINPSNNNSKGRTFCCVSAGAEDIWRATDPSSSGDTIVAAGSPGWTINQWVGYSLHFRFGSNGFTQHFTASITASTSNSVTLAGTGVGDSAGPDSLFFICGNTATAAPNFDSATDGNLIVFDEGDSQGFSIIAGSTTLTTSSFISNLSNGDYVIIPGADLFGFYNGTIPQVVIPLIAKVVSGGGTNTLTISKAAVFSVSFGTGYSGTPLADNGSGSVGTYEWLEVPFQAFAGLNSLVESDAPQGVIQDCDNVVALTTGRDDDSPYGGLAVSNALNTGEDQHQNLNLLSGPQLRRYGVIAGSGTKDLTHAIGTSDVIYFDSPTGDTTLNAPSVGAMSNISQEITLIIVTSGTISYTLTFGTNFKSTGTLATGTSSGKYWIIKFISDGINWVELARSGPL